MPIDFPSNPQIDELYSAEDRTWRWTGVYWRAVTTTIGYTGSQGEQGEGFRVLGSFPTVEDLPADSSGQPGDAYVITSTGEIWVWDGFNWNNLGQFVGYTGSRGATGFTGSQGRDGNFGGVTLDYTFSSDTDSSLDPGAGKLKFNDVNMLSSTLMYIGDTDDFSVNLDNYLATIDASTSEIRGHFRISRKGMPEQFVMFAITDQTVNQGTYFIVSCSYVSGNLSDSSTAFDDGDDILITFARTGDKGDTGYTGSSGFTGSQGATGTSVRIVGSLATSSQLPNPYGGDIGDGYIVEDTGHLWLWDGTQWNDIGKLTGEVGPTGFTGSQGEIGYTGSEGESTFTWGPTPPENPAIGDRWFDTIVGAVAVYVDDGDTLAWLEVAGSGFMGQTGYTGSGGPSGPRVASIDYPGDATAADPAGGETIGIVGSGFEYGAHVLLDNQAVGQVTFVNANRLEIVAPAKTAGSYAYLYVINADGGVAIHVPGVQYSGLPTWSTPSAGSLGSVYETQTINQSFGAVSDSSVTYSLVSGTLPSGSTLDPATGTLSGTAGLVDNATTYTFTIRATDAESQTADRQFSLTIDPDSVTWNFPSAGSVIEIPQDEASTTTLSASAVTGSPVTYSVSALPDGLTLSGDTVSGTATTLGDTAATATATASSTAAAASVSLTWRVVLGGDLYFRQTTLLLNADNNTFITDASDNAFTITPAGDTRPSAFSPYNTSWSNFFDGTGDYLSVANTVFNCGNDPFTIEGWFYAPEWPGSGFFSLYGISNGGGGTLKLAVYDNGNGSIDIDVNGSTAFSTDTTVMSLMQSGWTHFALVRESTSSNSSKVYINGQINGIGTISANYTGFSGPFIIGHNAEFYSNPFKGYISNFRIVKGIAVYTGNFTPPTAPLEATQSAGTNIAAITGTSTSLLTCQSNRFIDNSTNNFTLTRNGDVKVTSFGPFTETDTSTGSGYFSATSAYLTVPSDTSLVFGTNDFTVECWFNPTTTTAVNISFTGSATNTWRILTFANKLYWQENGVNLGAVDVPLNSWSHLAISREATTLRIFVNGVQGYSATNSFNYSVSPERSIGPLNGGSAPAYISNFRVVKGTALYTADFDDNLPTSPLTSIANTSLLTLQNRISYNNSQPIDESGIRNVITRNGNASAGTFSPHVPTGWSAYFDGTGDYLDLTDASNDCDLGGRAASVDFWVYATDTSATKVILNKGGGGTSPGPWNTTDGLEWTFVYVDGGTFYFQYNNAGATGSITSSISTGTWTHFAVATDASNNISFYKNGARVASPSSNAITKPTTRTTVRVGGDWTSQFYSGYMSGLRFLTGANAYDPTDTTITIPTAPPTNVSGTSLLTLRGPSFTDDGPNRFAITRNGDTRITPFSPFAPHTRAPDTYSVYFDGTGDYVRFPTNADYAFSTGDFTIELWFYLTADLEDSNNTLIANDTTPGWQIGKDVGNTFCFMPDGSIERLRTPTIDLHRWYHITYCRENGVLYGFLDGQTLGTVAMTTNFTNQVIDIGVNRGGTDYITGYISNVRLIKGRALYTDQNGFTPSTTPLIPTNDTVLLTLREGSFSDLSKNRAVPTVNGNSQPTQFNPFGETVTTGVEYAPASHGGSVYFDGTGDYLTVADSATLEPSSSDFTIECWIYPQATGSFLGVFAKRTNNSTGYSPVQVLINNGTMVLGVSTTGTSWNFTPNASTSPALNEWSHIAVVRNGTVGNNIVLYLNGVAVASGGVGSTALNDNAGAWSIGADSDDGGGNFNGYISSFRYVKGTALYTSAFVPPAAPSDPIPATTLLTCGNNAAIQDRTARNVLQTVGNARVANGVKKFGSGAMSFDGTGDWLLASASENNLIVGDVTIEFWVYPISIANVPIVLGFEGSPTDWVQFNNNIQIGVGNNATMLAATANGNTVSLNVWSHVALTRSGSTWRIFVNGVSQTVTVTGTATSNWGSSTAPMRVGSGRYLTSDYSLNGYIDDLRITKGVARTITLPTSTYTLR